MDCQTLRVEAAAQLLGLSRSAMYAAIRRRDIPHIRVGKLILVPRTALERLLATDATPAVVEMEGQ